jgi:MFS family permease
MGSPAVSTPGSGSEPSSSPPEDPGSHGSALALLRHGSFGAFLVSRLCAIGASQMVTVAIGWQVYELTNDPLALGFTGLAQFAMVALLAPITGDVADRLDRRRVLASCHAVYLVGALLLAWLVGRADLGVAPIYAVLALIGAARAFWMPTGQALLPALVPARDFQRAVALTSANFQVASIGGPALGGLLLRFGGVRSAYLAAGALTLVSLLLVLRLRYREEAREPSGGGWRRLLAGVAYVRSQPVILGAISLDLFAVLLGGATALMPIYARDLLKVGASGLGLLRAAPALGAGLVGLYLALRPIRRAAGRRMFACVALFGLATIAFGLSRSFPLSFLALVVLGGADMVSVVIRQTVVQIRTPPEMRGRVAAVNLVFIGASNELGELESGVTAAWLGTVPATLVGGVGTLLVTVLWMFLFPALARIERAEDLRAKD